jgi:hypothetical protein
VSAPQEKYPIQLNAKQEQAAKEWAADDRLWTTQETVEFNLRTFARKILAAVRVADGEGRARPERCGHKFIDSNTCLKCGVDARTLPVGSVSPQEKP